MTEEPWLAELKDYGKYWIPAFAGMTKRDAGIRGAAGDGSWKRPSAVVTAGSPRSQ